ncbi:hypothetical protein ACHAWO_001106 [Cyclotella atomus]|uniref:Uncharacterized protein n=1 Tax=Cyclotella atomus TaxID=382360 RepID=A0ABD3PJQ2_9STRA
MTTLGQDDLSHLVRPIPNLAMIISTEEYKESWYQEYNSAVNVMISCMLRLSPRLVTSLSDIVYHKSV